MSEMIPGNQKHLTLDDRIYIEHSLNEKVSFKDIARFLCKDPSTISKEVRKHRVGDWYHKGDFVNKHNFCVKRYRCKKVNVCEKIILCGVKCSSCPTCNTTCKDFEKERCDRLDRAPYVCNGCDKRISTCHIAHKYRYDPYFADRKYKEVLSSSREGINMSHEDLVAIDDVVTPLVAQGQSPYQILASHPEIDLSAKSIYNYIDSGLFRAKNFDLPRKVRLRPRKCKKPVIRDREIFIGRTYQDFRDAGIVIHTEMDTVLSSRASKRALLTFYVERCCLFLAFIIERNTAASVKNVFDRIEQRIGTYDFLRMFEFIVTDRGSEFSDPQSLETGINGIERTSIYYCDPMRSNQKGGIENAHTLLRRVLPKGTDFCFLTQWDVNTIVSHINSLPRQSLGGVTPYQMAVTIYGEDLLKALQLRPIAPDDVNLTPKLIRNN